jgi:hypothetical protein
VAVELNDITFAEVLFDITLIVGCDDEVNVGWTVGMLGIHVGHGEGNSRTVGSLNARIVGCIDGSREGLEDGKMVGA